MKDASNTCYACFHLFLFFKLQWIGKLVIMIKLIQYWLIGWFMFDSLTFPWQIFNTYSGNNKITELRTILQSGRERNSLTYKYYIEIQTVRSLYQYIVGLHVKIYLYKDVLISSNFSYYDGHYSQIYVYL
jgi:hypothetical protein